MKGKVVSNTAWYFVGTIVSAFCGLISAPILTRVLNTEVYAQYGMIATFTTLVATFIYMGQDEAFMRFYNCRGESYWIFLWKCIRIPIALCIAILVVLLEPCHVLLNWVFGTKISNTAAILLFLYIVMIVLQRFLMLTARMEERAANYSISNIATKVLFLVAVFACVFCGKEIGLNEIIIALMFGVCCAFGINVIAIGHMDHKSTIHAEGTETKELLRFGLPCAVSSTMFFAVPMIEKIVIREWTDWSILAIYTSAAIFVTVMNLIKTTVTSIWIPYVYKNYTNECSFKPVLHNIGIALAWFCLCILSFVVFFRRWLVLIFDQSYYDCNLIAPSLVCGSCFDLLSCIYAVGINIQKKTKYFMLVPASQLAVSSISLIILLPKLGLIATGISYLLSIAVSRVIQMTIALHLYGTGEKYTKLILMMLLYLAIGALTCFNTTMSFDFICSILLFLIGTILAKKEVLNVANWVLGRRKL